MNTKLLEINDIISACETMTAYIKENGTVLVGNSSHYFEYRDKINRFDDKHDLKNSDSVIVRGIHSVLTDLYWNRPNATVSFVEAETILHTIIRLKHELFPNQYEKIFISHCEKDKEQTEAFIEMLYAIGIQRPLANGESVVFCSSHPPAYIENGVRNTDCIRQQLISHDHVLCILWYTDNFFASQACLNEAGAIWALEKRYQEILHPCLERSRINGFLDNRITSFRSNDVARLNNFKAQLEQMFGLSPISQNSWEAARDRYIETITRLTGNLRGEQNG